MRDADARERQSAVGNSMKQTSEPTPRAGAAEAAFTIVEVLALIAIFCLMVITVAISLRAFA